MHIVITFNCLIEHLFHAKLHNGGGGDTFCFSLPSLRKGGKMNNKTTAMAVMVIAMMMAVCLVSIVPDESEATSTWDGSGSDQTWYNDEASTFTISTASQLAGLSAIVNGGNDLEGKTVSLSDSIDLNGLEWAPIGTESNPFKGIFSGAGYTVSNLSINDSSLECAGLFGYILTPASIQNVTVDGVSLTAKSLVGGLVGCAQTGSVSDCKVTGDIHIEGNYKVGGLVGGGYASISNCSVVGSDGSEVSGVYLETDYEGDNVGGLIGFRGEGDIEISGCSVENITVDGSRKIGGLVGSAYTNNDFTGCTVKNTVVSSNGTVDYITDNPNSSAIGGLVGLFTVNGNGGGSLKGSTVSGITLESDNPGVQMGYITGGQRGTNDVVEPENVDMSENKLEGTNSGANTLTIIRDGIAFSSIEDALENQTGVVKLFIPGGEYGMFLPDSLSTSVTIQPISGEDVTINIVPASACRDGTNHTCQIDSTSCSGTNPAYPDSYSAPDRVQSFNAQYQIFSGSVDVTIKNIGFVFTPSEFAICLNSGWGDGKYSADDVRNAELQFNNSGNVMLDNCTFDKVIVSPYASRGDTSVTECSFSNVYNAYAIKDIYSVNAEIVDCQFTDCGGAIYFEGDVPKGSYTISNNVFTDIDTADVAEEGKSGTRGLIQFSASGDYGNAVITIENNESTGGTAVFRQLNNTITSSVLDTSQVVSNNDFDGQMFVQGTGVTDPNTIYLDTTNGDDNNAGTTDSPVKTLVKAIELVNSGGIIMVSGELGSITGIDKPLSIIGNGEDRIVCGSIELPNVNGTVRFENLAFNNNCIADYSNSDKSGLSLEFENCAFSSSHHVLYITSSIHSLTVTDCVLNAPESTNSSYLIWTYSVDELTVTGTTFNGNGLVRGAIHPGNGSSAGTTVIVENNTFNGFERGLNIAFVNEKVNNTVKITDNTFSEIKDNPSDTGYDADHVATVYIHASQKAGTTTIDYTNNTIAGGSGRVFFSNSPTIPAQGMVAAETFQGNTLDGNAIDNLSDVCYDPWVATVDGTGYATLDEALTAASSSADKTVTLLETVYLDSQLDLSTDSITIDLGGYTITSSDDFSSGDENSSHLFNVMAEDITVMNGTLKITDQNKHVVNAYGASLTLRDVVLDASEGGEGFHAPLIINGSTVTLGGEVTFNGGSYYSINMDTTVADVSNVGLNTEAGTKLAFNGVPIGIYNEMSSEAGETASIAFGEGTGYTYDDPQFQLMVSSDQNSVDDEESSDPIDRVENPLYSVTISVEPSGATITFDGEQIQNGDTIDVEGGPHSITIELDGYVTISETINISSNDPISYKMQEASSVPGPGGDDDKPVIVPPVDDDDEYIPLPPQVVYDDPEDDGNVKIIACAAAAVVAALMAVFLILAYRRD